MRNLSVHPFFSLLQGQTLSTTICFSSQPKTDSGDVISTAANFCPCVPLLFFCWHLNKTFLSQIFAKKISFVLMNNKDIFQFRKEGKREGKNTNIFSDLSFLVKDIARCKILVCILLFMLCIYIMFFRMCKDVYDGRNGLLFFSLLLPRWKFFSFN